MKNKLKTQDKFSLGQIGSNIRFNIMNALGTGSASSEPNLAKKESLSNPKDKNNINFNIFPSWDDKAGSNYGTINEVDEDNESVSYQHTNLEGSKVGVSSENDEGKDKEDKKKQVDKIMKKR